MAERSRNADFYPNTALLHHLASHRLLKGFADLDKAGQHGVHAVAMARMLRQQDRIVATDCHDNAGAICG